MSLSQAIRSDEEPLTERRLRTSVGAVVAASLLVPAVVVAARLVGRRWMLTRDSAGIDVRARDVFSTHLPLTGAYHGDWSHPGPLMYWVLGPFAILGRPWVTVVGGAVVQTVAILLAAWLAWRLGGVWLLLVVSLVGALSYRAADAQAPMGYVWNPSIAFPFFVLFLVAVAAAITGRPRQLILATAAGSFVVQAHIGYALVVAALGLWAVGAAVADERRVAGTWRTTRLRDTAVRSAIVAAVLWSGPTADAVLHRGGNLRRIVTYFVHAREPVAGLRRGAELFAAEFRWPPPWLVGREWVDAGGAARPASLVFLLVPMVLIAGGLLAARASGSRDHRRLMITAALVLVVSIVSLSRVTVPALPPYFWWSHPAALSIVAAAVVAVGGLVGQRLGVGVRPRVAVAVAGAAAVTVASVSVGVATNRRIDDARVDFTTAEAVLPPLRAAFPRGGTVLIRGVLDSYDLPGAVMDELDRRGFDVRVDDGYAAASEFGAHRTTSPDHVTEIWVVVQNGWLVSDLAGRSGVRTVARYTPLDRSDEATLVRLQQQMLASLRPLLRPSLLEALDAPDPGRTLLGVPGIDGAAVRQLEALNRRARSRPGRRSVVLAVSPSASEQFTTERLAPGLHGQ